jgi:hypothetical protein
MEYHQSIEFRLEPPTLGYGVTVRLRAIAERWLAVATSEGGEHLGLGGSAREALGAALFPLGPLAMRTLLADPGLFGASASLESARRVAPR